MPSSLVRLLPRRYRATQWRKVRVRRTPMSSPACKGSAAFCSRWHGADARPPGRRFRKADILIEDGKIREIRPEIAVSGDAAEVVDATNRSSFPASSIPTAIHTRACCGACLPSGVVDPDYNRDIRATSLRTSAVGCACRGAGDRARFMEMGTTSMVDISQVTTRPSTATPSSRVDRRPASDGLRLFARCGPASKYPQDMSRLRASLFQLQGPIADARHGDQPDPKMFEYTREIGLPIGYSREGSQQYGETLLALATRRTITAGRRISSIACISPMPLAPDQGHGGRTSLIRLRSKWRWRTVARDPGRARQRRASQPQLRPQP